MSIAMKATASILFAFLFPALSFAQIGFGRAEKINQDWKFLLEDVQDGQGRAVEDKSWKTVQLPHDWSVREQLSPSLASATGYLPGGIAWYRKKIDIPSDRKGQKLYLYFEGVYNRSEVFLNGHSLGKRPNGYVSFAYDITPYVEYGADNLLAVRVDHSQHADSRWYTGSGIYRDVWLVAANPVHIDQWGVHAYPEADKSQGSLHVRVRLHNESAGTATVSVLNELLDPNGTVVAKKTSRTTLPRGDKNDLQSTLEVKNPALWSVDAPNQYRLRTTVLRDGKAIDRSEVKTGFRTFTFDPNKGFALNGEWMKMKGVCLHHDAGVLGAAVYPEVWRRRLLALKTLGVNAIRTSHNPQATSLYELCDEIGLLVMNEAYDEWEFPKRKWLKGWNVGTPGFQGSYDFFEEWGEKDLEDIVKRDRNHLSIFAWSIGNEVDYPNDPYSHPVLDGSREGGFTQPIFGGYKKDAPDAMRLGAMAKRLAAVVRKHDPSRPVTAGLAGVAMSNETEYPAALDIAGYNYTESRYREDHERYPERVIYGSENRHDHAAWLAVRDNAHIFGQFLWTGIDYLGESGRWPSRGFYSGLLDFAGFVKPRGYFRQSLWSADPMAYLGTYPLREADRKRPPAMDAWPIWNYRDGQSIRVVCYTNSPKLRLELNGRTVGDERSVQRRDGIAYWDIPYAAGKLEVVGMDGQDRETCRYAIRSGKRPRALLANALSEKPIKKGEVLQIEVRVVDEDGVPVMLSDEEVTCEIIGNARLLGMEAGNNTDMGDYTDNRQRVFHGRMMVYIQPNGEPDEPIAVRFTAPWLKEARLTIDN